MVWLCFAFLLGLPKFSRVVPLFAHVSLKNWEIASWHLHEFSGGCDSVRGGAWSLGWGMDSVHMENFGYVMAPLRSFECRKN